MFDKKDVDRAVVEIRNADEDRGFLDHEICAFEEILLKKIERYGKDNSVDGSLPPHIPRVLKIFKYIRNDGIPVSSYVVLVRRKVDTKTEIKFEIFYDDNVTLTEKRFFVGHELGHLVFDLKIEEILDLNRREFDSRDFATESQENRATYFACKLLLGRTAFYKNKKKMRELKVSKKKLQKVAKKYCETFTFD